MKTLERKGTIILSIDLELAWGNGGKEFFKPLHKKERYAINTFLELCATYDIPCTWATVGNLFLRDKNEAQQRGIELFGNAKKIYDAFLEGNEETHLWFGEDIIRDILACQTPQEIGAHTFFHTLATETDSTQFQKELTQTRTLGKEKFNIDIRSFVYPRNQIAHLDTLLQTGFINYRGNDVASVFGPTFGKTRLAHYVESLCALPIPATHTYTTDTDLTMIPASYFMGVMLAKQFSVPMPLRLRRCRSGIQNAILDNGIFHLWFHPHNLAKDLTLWLQGLKTLFQYIAEQREAGKLNVHTMGSYTDEIHRL